MKKLPDISVNFNPRSSCEERPESPYYTTNYDDISIHAPHARSDRYRRCNKIWRKRFQSTLLMRGATETAVNTVDIDEISIHAPHARSDGRTASLKTPRTSYFNPRSSCEERHVSDIVLVVYDAISIHAPHARSDGWGGCNGMCRKISIHAPHARSDWMTPVYTYKDILFQSTLLMRGAT